MEKEQEPSLQKLELLFAQNYGSHAVPITPTGEIDTTTLYKNTQNQYAALRALQANSIYTQNAEYVACDNPFARINRLPKIKDFQLNPNIENTKTKEKELLIQVNADIKTLAQRVSKAISHIQKGGNFKTPIIGENGSYRHLGIEILDQLQNYLQNLQDTEVSNLTPALILGNIKGKVIPIHTPLSANVEELFVDGGFCDDFENTSFFINEPVFIVKQFKDFTLVTCHGKTGLVSSSQVATIIDGAKHNYTYFVGTKPKAIRVDGQVKIILPADRILQKGESQYVAVKNQEGLVEYINITDQFTENELKPNLGVKELVEFAATVNVPYNTLYDCSSFIQRLLNALPNHPDFMRYSGDISRQLEKMVGKVELNPNNLQNLEEGVYVYNIYYLKQEKEISVHTGLLVVQSGIFTSVSQAFSIKSNGTIESPMSLHISNTTIQQYVNSESRKVRVHKISL